MALILFVRFSTDETARALPANDIADVVFGQNGSFDTNACLPVTASTLCNTINGAGVAVDAAGNVYIADRQNNRVLQFDTPLTTDTAADRVFGQNGDFTTSACLPLGADSLCRPGDIALDSAGRLWVVDTLNNRVLIYNSPLTTDTVADNVLGQAGSFTTSGGCESVTASSICFASGRGGIAVDSAGNVFVAERNRVLEFTSPLTTDQVADRVFGQLGNFTANTCGQNLGITANSLCAPSGVAVDPAGNVYIVDAFANRVLEYDTPATLGTTADRVYGQGNFLSGTCNGAPLSLAVLCTTFMGTPNGSVTLDAAGNVYVSDLGNARVLQYDAPLTTDTIADRVYGQQGNAAETACGTGAGRLCAPVGLATDSSGALFVVDAGNNRAVVYLDALKPGVHADAVFGQLGSFSTFQCGLTADSVCNSGGVAVDASGNVFIADRLRHRVLGYDTPLTTDTTADLVFGQGGSFASGDCNLGGRSENTLCNPIGLAVDGGGNLYVVDAGNNRVLQYDTPFTSDTTADRVFGQSGSFATAACSVGGFQTASTLCFANSWGDVTVDIAGNVYVADSFMNRVLEYDTPLTTDTVADRVFGQLGVFEGNVCNGGGRTASTLCMPTGVAVDSAGNLYILDGNNNRALEYDTPLTGDTVADRVFGQAGSFETGSCNNGGVGPGSLCLSQFGSSRGNIDVDSFGNVFLTDSVNQRILEYDTPLISDVSADRVYGQLAQDYSTTRCNNGSVSRASLCRAEGVEVDGGNNLYIADSQNNRVLVFVADADVDGDGCSDVEEFSTNVVTGGKRDPDNPWDFYDVNGTQIVDAVDIGLVRIRFAASVPASVEDEPYNRSAGAAAWAPGPPDTYINAVDIALVRNSFNHSCQGPP